MGKQITTSSRLVNQLERMTRALIHDFFNDAMPMPIITITATARAYAHYSVNPVWNSKGEAKHEINISSAYLDRGLEYICSSALHELCHYYGETVLNVSTASRGGTYHPKAFKEIAESHGLVCTRTEKYGWSDTSSILSEQLIEWVLLHDEFREIELCRTVADGAAAGTGGRAAHGGAPTTTTTKSNSIRHVCPKCGAIARTTRPIRLICADCLELMIV